MKTAFPSLRRFAAWATASTDNYRHNPFIRATVNVILMQIVLSALMIAVFWLALEYAQNRTVDTITLHITQLFEGTATPGTLTAMVDAVRTETLLYVFLGIITLSSLFGFLLARYALWPARNSLQFQKRFIGNVAHEIRTPMAIIKTNTEVALMDPKLSQSNREIFEETIAELDRMSETINNLLTFDTLVRPGSMKTAPVSLAPLLATVVARHQELADSRGVTLMLTIHNEANVNGNATALEQIATNLVKNAINYTPEHKGKHVTVTLACDFAGRAILTVTDEGIGIAKKDLDHIFEPFYRADTSRARGIGTGSSGLGLAIVSEIVRLHHGSITARSTLGEGTAVRITLPATKAQPQLPEGPEPVTAEFTADFGNR